jgi:Icc-related predicted phosphoesterase
MEKIAIISDIHGNITALDTVLKDIKRRGIKRIFCLGDLVGKGPRQGTTGVSKEPTAGVQLRHQRQERPPFPRIAGKSAPPRVHGRSARKT